jgi:protein SCO1/2
MTNARLSLAIASIALAATGCGGTAAKHASGQALTQTTAVGAPALGGSTAVDFALRDQNRRLVRLSAQRGRLVLLTFLYTHCRDVCPLIAENLNDVLRRVGPERRDVRVIGVSVDPARDTHIAIRQFVRSHRLLPQFLYVTGPRRRLQQVWQNYNVLAMPRNSQVIDHSAPVLLIDQRGKPRIYYPSNVTTGPVLKDVRRLLAASS